MAYSRTNWVSGTTPLSAANMNNIEDGIEELNSNISTVNIESVQRVSATVTTGSTGNVSLNLSNDGYNYVVAPMVSGASAYLRAWVSPNSNDWYLTAVNPNTGAVIANTSLAIRYLRVKIKAL